MLQLILPLLGSISILGLCRSSGHCPSYRENIPRRLINLHLILLSTQHDVPHGKHALILVKQPKGNLVWISTQETATANKMAPPPSASDKDKKFEPRLKTWNDCDYIQVIKSLPLNAPPLSASILNFFISDCVSVSVLCICICICLCIRLYLWLCAPRAGQASVFAFANFNEKKRERSSIKITSSVGRQDLFFLGRGKAVKLRKKRQIEKEMSKNVKSVVCTGYAPHPQQTLYNFSLWFSTVIAPALCACPCPSSRTKSSRLFDRRPAPRSRPVGRKC